MIKSCKKEGQSGYEYVALKDEILNMHLLDNLNCAMLSDECEVTIDSMYNVNVWTPLMGVPVSIPLHLLRKPEQMIRFATLLRSEVKLDDRNIQKVLDTVCKYILGRKLVENCDDDL